MTENKSKRRFLPALIWALILGFLVPAVFAAGLKLRLEKDDIVQQLIALIFLGLFTAGHVFLFRFFKLWPALIIYTLGIILSVIYFYRILNIDHGGWEQIGAFLGFGMLHMGGLVLGGVVQLAVSIVRWATGKSKAKNQDSEGIQVPDAYDEDYTRTNE